MHGKTKHELKSTAITQNALFKTQWVVETTTTHINQGEWRTYGRAQLSIRITR